MLAADLTEVERMAKHELHLGGELGYVILAAPDPDDGLQRRFALGRAHWAKYANTGLDCQVKSLTRAMYAATSAGAIRIAPSTCTDGNWRVVQSL